MLSDRRGPKVSKFLNELSTRTTGDDDESVLELTESLLYQSDLAQQVIVVPQHFRTDLASVPRLPLVYLATGNIARKAAVVHDFLYSDARMPRSKCDAIFLEACKASGVSWWQRWLMWAGVRIGGASHYTPRAA
jgi:hypothetical protein